MATITRAEPVPYADGLRRGASLQRASRHDPRWVLRGAQLTDIAAVKALCYDLHTFNASLDLRCALSGIGRPILTPTGRRPCAKASRCAWSPVNPRGSSYADSSWPRSITMRACGGTETGSKLQPCRWKTPGAGTVLPLDQPMVQLYATACNEDSLIFSRQKVLTEEVLAPRSCYWTSSHITRLYAKKVASRQR